jgi:hypothetical protein
MSKNFFSEKRYSKKMWVMDRVSNPRQIGTKTPKILRGPIFLQNLDLDNDIEK